MKLSPGATAGYLVWRLAMKWTAACDRAVAPMGLTQAQYSLLASLYGLSYSGSRPSQRELADYTGLDPIFVSKLARTLESRGLLRRDEHPADSRAVQLSLTEAGTAAVVPAIAAVRDLQEEITAPLGGTSSARTVEFIDALRTLLGQDQNQDRSGDMTTSTDTTTTDTATTTTSANSAQPLPLTGQHIGQAANATRAILDAVLAKEQTPFPEWIAMRTLDTRGAFESRAAFEAVLAGGLALVPATVPVLVDELLWQGAITHDATGRIALSESGQARYDHLNERVTAVTAQIYGDLDREQMAVAARLLDQVTERALKLRATL